MALRPHPVSSAPSLSSALRTPLPIRDATFLARVSRRLARTPPTMPRPGGPSMSLRAPLGANAATDPRPGGPLNQAPGEAGRVGRVLLSIADEGADHHPPGRQHPG